MIVSCKARPILIKAIHLEAVPRKHTSGANFSTVDSRAIVNWKEAENFCGGGAIGNTVENEFEALCIRLPAYTSVTGIRSAVQQMALPDDWIIKKLDGNFEALTSAEFKDLYETLGETVCKETKQPR